MALFGRRKPGFAKEVELKPSEIPGEFSDALDPAVDKALDRISGLRLRFFFDIFHPSAHSLPGEGGFMRKERGKTGSP